MGLKQDGRGARIDTPLGKDVLVLSGFSIAEEFSSGFSGMVDLRSENSEIDGRALIGETVTITLDTPPDKGAGPRYFHAHVRSFVYAGAQGRLARYTMEIVPWMHVLSLRSDCRIWLKKTVPEIIKKTLELTPFSPFLNMKDVAPTYPKRDYCVQYNETVADFIFRLMQETGIASQYHHFEDEHKLVLSDINDSFHPAPGVDSIPYMPPERQSRETECITAWHWQNAISSGAYVTTDYDFTRPDASLMSTSTGPDGHTHDDGELFAWPGGFTDEGEGVKIAGIRREQAQVGRESVMGRSNVTGLQVGHVFTLTDFPRASANRQWLVTRINHTLSGIEYESGANTPGDYSNTFEVCDPKHLYRPSDLRVRPRIHGAQTAVVTGKPGEEIDTDEYGRVTVHFHWDRHGPMDGNSSCRIRVRQDLAGSGFGGQWIPRIGQEVLVEYLDGDPDRPVITGALYNGNNKPPFELPANMTQSGWKTQSTKEGGAGHNMLRFEDKKGEEQLYIHAEKDEDIVVKNNATRSVGVDRTKTVGGNEVEIVEGDRDLSVRKNQMVAIDENYSIDVGKNFEITVGDEISIVCGKSSIIMKKNGTILIEGTTIKTKSKTIRTSASGSHVLKGKKIDLN